MAEAREAKVKVILDINNTLTQIDRIQKKLDTLSIKNLTEKDTTKLFNGLTGNADRAKASIDGLRSQYIKAVKDMEDAMKKNKLSFTFSSSDEYKQLYNKIIGTSDVIKHCKSAIGEFKKAQQGFVKQKTLNDIDKLNKSLELSTNKLLDLGISFSLISNGNESQAFSSTIKRMTDELKEFKSAMNSKDVNNFANAVNRVGNRPTNTNNNTQNPQNPSNNPTGWLTTYWASEQDEMFKYFFVRLKSGVAKSLGTYVENYITNAIPNTVNSLINYEQNRVNFAQVMPEDIGNNQKLMNNAMREFMNIASDYGTSVQEVTEAGRLWGRQYKDVAMVQELVRNSTKLSITDNMSLTEVNKALEATMQQYNVKLKDANEAQQVSGRIVDVWAKLADNAVVTAQDLARASEQAGGSAYQAGVSFDYLQAMIATMSTTTGKSGAEVGRAIRSMLVSMNSAKAQKFFTQLGIATKELGKDGVMRVRSFEKVITDLMKKLKTYPKDASSAILAMSGGKYQYNNVMALLKSYDLMQQNLKTIREADGWADTQVKQQRETLSRTIQSLQADLEKIVITINEAGASEGLKSLLNGVKQLAQIIAQIDTRNLDRVGYIFTLYLGARAIGNVAIMWGKFRTSVVGANSSLNALGVVTTFVSNTFKGATTSVTGFATALSRLSVILGVAMLAYTAIEAVMKNNRKETEKAEKEAVKNAETQAKAISDKVKLMNDEMGLTDDYIAQVSKLSDVIKDSTKSDDEKAQASKKLSEVEEWLIKAIGEEATARVKASGFTKEALEQERKAILAKKIASDEQTRGTIINEINSTNATIENTKARIKAIETEIRTRQALAEGLANSARNKHQSYQKYIAENGEDGFMAKMFKADADRAYSRYQSAQEESFAMLKALETASGNLDSLYNTATNLRKLESGDTSGFVTSSNSNNKLNGMTRPEVDPNSPNGKNKKSSSSGGVTSEKFEVNALQAEYNKLIVDGKNSLNKYNNELKEINNNEKNNKDSVTAFIEKNELYKERLDTLQKEQKAILDYRNKLVGLIDDEMKKDSNLVQLTGYKLDGTIKEKLENIEVNKETYQHFKNLQKIVNLLNSANSELIKYDGTIEDATQKIKEQQLAMDIISVSQRNIADINQRYNMINASNNGLYVSDNEKNKIELARNQELLSELEAQKIKYENDLLRLSEDRNSKEYRTAKENLDKISLEYENTLGKIRAIQMQETLALSKTISQSVTDNMANMLTAGQDFKTTMKNIWNDLTSYIIKRLLQVYVYEQLTGLLQNAFAPSSKTPTANGTTIRYGNVRSSWTYSHQGSNINGYPKMHSGGAVELGRQGVNPQLKNDEVVRTLQVGEEVNSIKDRRSNEILGMVAMKAMDSKNEQPQNIYITALDSRSFAEYMNDNADVLTAVLAKQGVLGRR